MFITTCIYLSYHEEGEILKEHQHINLIKDFLNQKEKNQIQEIISDVRLNQLRKEIYFDKYFENDSGDRLKFRIKFNLKWFLKNIKE